MACTSEAIPPVAENPPAEEGCAPGERPLEDGSCLPAGVVICGAGFEAHPSEGCIATTPVCAFGTMAVPGETTCREVAPCPRGRWGELPSDAGIQYVDAEYAGSDNDGSEARPWAALADAIAASPPGGVIALAAGTYPAGYEVIKAVRIHGKCPAETTITGDASAFTIAFTTAGATGSELHDVAVTGPGIGVAFDGPSEALVERVWIHDTTNTALHTQANFGATSVVLRGVLIESVQAMGAYALGATLRIEASSIRDVVVGGPWGIGVFAQSGGRLDLGGSVVERCAILGIGFQGAGGNVMDTLVRDNVLIDVRGAALGVADEPFVSGSQVTARGLVIERNGPRGVAVAGSMLTLEDTVVRDTSSAPDGTTGRGISVEDSLMDGRRSNVVVLRSLALRNKEIGIFGAGSDLVLESVAVRDTAPNSAVPGGRALGVQGNPMTGSMATAAVRWSALEASMQAALFIGGQQVTVEDTLVRDTRPDSTNGSGRGIEVRDDVNTGARGHLTLRRSRIESSHEEGLLVFGADLVAEDVTVVGTHANSASLFGDGIAVIASDESGMVVPASASILRARVDTSARAGIASLGGHITLRDSVITCSAFPLVSETYLAQASSLVDEGGNTCGCDDAQEPCRAVTANLQAPSPLDPATP